MLLAPVTRVIDPRQLTTSLSAMYAPATIDRYCNPAMPPLAAHPPVQRSVTGMIAL
jgi:hypothetical protein